MQRLSIASSLVLATPAFAQDLVAELYGAAGGDRFGEAVAFVGDLDHDGRADFAVGAPGDSTAGALAGSVTVYSGVDRSVLWHWDGLTPGGELGSSVDGAGDLDLDGTEDVIAGAPGVGQVLVFSGQTGAVIHDLSPGAPGFGTAVAGLGLADGDAWPDIAVGATGGSGLWVFSGRTGGVHWTNPMVTRELSDLGDVDGDGRADLIAGDHEHDFNAGRAVVLSGLTGAVIREHVGSNTFQDKLGKGVAGLGDVDGDGVGDYGYGVPCICFASHYVNVHSGASGALVHTISVYTFGWDVAPAGDLDLDGTADVLVCEPGPLHAYSGADWTPVGAPWGGGEVIDGGRDATGDGLMDVLAGDPGDDTAGTDAGRVSLSTFGCLDPAPTNHCTALANSTGLPAAMSWQGSVSIIDNSFRLLALDCPPNEFGLFFYGATPTQLSVGDGNLCVAPPIFRLPVVNTGAGAASWLLDFGAPPNPPGQISPGETWHFSFWYRNPSGGPAGYNFADGLRASFCP